MKKLLIALLIALAPSFAWAQCNGVFPPSTLCGNLSGVSAVPGPFPASGTIAGPVSSTLNGLPIWANTLGTQLKDGAGLTVAGAYTWSGTQTYSATNTFNALANFTSTFQVGGQTFTWPAAGTTVAGLGTSQTFAGNNTFTGNNTFSTGTVNFTGTTQLNGGAITTVLSDNTSLNNCSFAASVATNILTVALKDASGADPSASSPCSIGFRDPTATTGSYSVVQTTAANSVATPASGATLGSINGGPLRVWVVAFNNSGSVVLALWTSVTYSSGAPAAVAPLNDAIIASTTAISGSSTSAGVFYGASAVTNKTFRILGFVEFSAGQATAGVWATSPTLVRLFGPGVKKPGDIVQAARTQTGASATGTKSASLSDTIPTNTIGDQYMSQAITPTSQINLLVIRAKTNVAAATADIGIGTALFQDAVVNALTAVFGNTPSGASQIMSQNLDWWMISGLNVSTTFKVQCWQGGGATTLTFNGSGGGRQLGGALTSFLDVTEVMT